MVDYRKYANIRGNSGGLLGGFLNARAAQGQSQLDQDKLDRQSQLDLVGGLKSGINTQRLNEPKYIQEVADQRLQRLNRPLGSSEFERLVSISQSDDFENLPQGQKDLINARLGSIAKDTNVLQNQAFATAQGKGQAELGFKPELAREVELQKGLGKAAADKVSVGNEAIRGVEDIEVAGGNINRILSQNPDLVGGYAPIKTAASRYNLPGGFSEQEQEQKGELTRNLSSLQNKALALATQAGQSGINIQAEVDRITQGLQQTSTPAEIRGAIKAMQETQDRLARQLSNQGNEVQQQGVLDNNDPLGLR